MRTKIISPAIQKERVHRKREEEELYQRNLIRLWYYSLLLLLLRQIFDKIDRRISREKKILDLSNWLSERKEDNKKKDKRLNRLV